MFISREAIGLNYSSNIQNEELRKTKTIINHHTINSLKRPTKKMRKIIVDKTRLKLLISNLSPPISTTNSFKSFIAINIILLLLYIVSINVTNCDVVCPKDTSIIYPCSCNNGTQGLLIKCSRSNLAILANSLKNLQEPVEQVEVEHSVISKLFGPLFNDSSYYKFHSTIRELDIRDSGLRSIDQSSFSQLLKNNIQYLMFDRNLLQQIPNELLNSMTNLKLLNFSTNLINSIEPNTFVRLTNLTELDLSNNKISKLSKSSFNSLNSLEILNLNGNELSKLDKNLFSFGRKLRSLDLSNNKLTNLDRQDFNELTNLETLRVSNNLLTTLPRSIFSRNAKLYNLDLSFNKLEDIDTYLFKSVRFLKDLNMSGNLIKEITKNTFSPTTRIKRINMSQNLIQALAPETFKQLEWLENINLSHNQIVNISNDAFNHIYSVEIDLSFNKLTRIFYYAFHEVSNITKLDLSHNLIDDGISLIAFEQTDCAFLDLSYNQIQDISKIPINNFTGIRILDLSHNQITEFNKKSFTQKIPLYELHTIDASFNNISQISGNILEKLKSIRYFNISHNSLRRLTSGGLGNSPTLLELDLSFNNLVEVVSGTLVGLVSMKNLDLRYNRLKKMIPIPVALNSIHLEHNEIGQLSRSAFPSLNSLLELYLDHNRISNIEEGTFSTLLALHTLSLSYNNLSSIPALALKDLASLQLLKMDGNNVQRLNRKAFGVLPIVFNLHLDHNNISSISDHAFDGMLQLLTLNLSYNNILEIPPEAFAGLVSLRNLDLSNNQVNRFENKTRSAMEDLLSLEVANFSNNKLSIVTPKTFLSSPYIPYKLTHLDLSNNLIGIIMNHFVNGLKKVEWLSLKNNIINEIYPNVLGNASQLKYLDLSYNKLRTLKEGTFNGQLLNLSTILLNNNKLSNLQAKEFDRLKSLSKLDLSSNRLEIFHKEYIRWVKKGVALDMRYNNLDCSCDLVPFIAWIDSVQARNQSYNITPGLTTPNYDSPTSSQALANIQNTVNSNSLLLSKYLSTTQLVSNLNCTKPEIMNMKSIMHLLELSPSIEMNCDKSLLEEADNWRRLKAPIHYTGAEPYYYNGEQHLKIGWNLLDPYLDVLNFVIIKAKFQQPFDLSSYRSTTRGTFNNRLETNDYLLLEYQVERVAYSQRTSILHGFDPVAFNVICISYETSDYSPINMIDQSSQQAIKSSLQSQQDNQNYPTKNENNNNNHHHQNFNSSFNSILNDYLRINCVDLESLLHYDRSEKLISGAATSTLRVNDHFTHHYQTMVILNALVVVVVVLFSLIPQRNHFSH